MTGVGEGLLLAGSGAAASAAYLSWAVRGRSAAVFGQSVWRGPKQRRAIALTFDDGPSESTPYLLGALAKFGVSATFFQCGANVDRLPSISRDVALAGHEIGNHGYSHSMLCFKGARFIESELRRTQEAIAARTGCLPRWFRAPFGVRWFGLHRAQRRLNLTGVMWTVIGYDWKLKAVAVAERLAARAGNGSILCLHDGRELRARPEIGATLDAVRRLIPRLLDEGYRFETVTRLICPTS